MSDLLTDREPRVEIGGYWAHRDADGQWWVWGRDGKQWELCNPYEMILLDVIAGQRDSMDGQDLLHKDDTARQQARIEALKHEIDTWEDCVRKGDSEIETLQERTRGLEALTAVSAVALRDAIRQLRYPVQDVHDRIAIANRAAHVLTRYDATKEAP